MSRVHVCLENIHFLNVSEEFWWNILVKKVSNDLELDIEKDPNIYNNLKINERTNLERYWRKGCISLQLENSD